MLETNVELGMTSHQAKHDICFLTRLEVIMLASGYRLDYFALFQ